MTENPDAAKCPADPERSPKLREWLIDTLALAMGGLAVYHYKPDGFFAGLIMFVGAYTFTHSLQGLNWQSHRVISQVLLVVFTPIVHLTMLLMAPTETSVQGLVCTMLLPGIAQAYWLWELWPATGVPSHPLAVMCAAWLAVLGVWLAANAILRLQAMGSGLRPPPGPGLAFLERHERPARPIPVMTENPDPAKCPADPERSPSRREWLIDALALAMGGLAVYHYKPDGFLVGLILFIGAYTLTHSLQGLNWQSLRAISQFLLVLLTPVVHMATVVMVPTASVKGLIYTMLLPGIAQAYWLWELWPAMGIPFHRLAVMCAAWLAVLGVWLLTKAILHFQARGSRLPAAAEPSHHGRGGCAS